MTNELIYNFGTSIKPIGLDHQSMIEQMIGNLDLMTIRTHKGETLTGYLVCVCTLNGFNGFAFIVPSMGYKIIEGAELDISTLPLGKHTCVVTESYIECYDRTSQRWVCSHSMHHLMDVFDFLYQNGYKQDTNPDKRFIDYVLNFCKQCADGTIQETLKKFDNRKIIVTDHRTKNWSEVYPQFPQKYFDEPDVDNVSGYDEQGRYIYTYKEPITIYPTLQKYLAGIYRNITNLFSSSSFLNNFSFENANPDNMYNYHIGNMLYMYASAKKARVEVSSSGGDIKILCNHQPQTEMARFPYEDDYREAGLDLSNIINTILRALGYREDECEVQQVMIKQYVNKALGTIRISGIDDLLESLMAAVDPDMLIDLGVDEETVVKYTTIPSGIPVRDEDRVMDKVGDAIANIINIISRSSSGGYKINNHWNLQDNMIPVLKYKNLIEGVFGNEQMVVMLIDIIIAFIAKNPSVLADAGENMLADLLDVFKSCLPDDGDVVKFLAK